MKKWENRVVSNILEQSKSTDFENAIKEWFFNGKIYDRKKPSFSCELCGHSHVRYHYIIENKATKKQLMAGSSCILKYNTITILDSNNNPITSARLRKNALEDALDKTKLEQVRQSLRELWRLSSDTLKPTIAGTAQQYIEDGYTTPKVCLMWFTFMTRLKISYEPQLFKINLRKSKYLDQAVDFKKFQLDLITPALSTQQLKKINDIRTQFE